MLHPGHHQMITILETQEGKKVTIDRNQTSSTSCCSSSIVIEFRRLKISVNETAVCFALMLNVHFKVPKYIRLEAAFRISDVNLIENKSNNFTRQYDQRIYCELFSICPCT